MKALPLLAGALLGAASVPAHSKTEAPPVFQKSGPKKATVEEVNALEAERAKKSGREPEDMFPDHPPSQAEINFTLGMMLVTARNDGPADVEKHLSRFFEVLGRGGQFPGTPYQSNGLPFDGGCVMAAIRLNDLGEARLKLKKFAEANDDFLDAARLINRIHAADDIDGACRSGGGNYDAESAVREKGRAALGHKAALQGLGLK